MARDTFTTVVDDVTDNLATYRAELVTALNNIERAVPFAAYKTATTMSGNVTLDDDDDPIQSFDPDANRDVTLPAVAATNGAFYIINRDASFTLTIKNAGGSTITTISAGAAALVLSDGANNWYSIGAGSFPSAPNFSDFTNANHDHGDANDGGALVAAAITGLHGYPLFANGSAFSPADSTTYYFGTPFDLPFTTGESTARIYIPKPGTITKILLHARPTAGSNEQSTVSLRLNNLSDTNVITTLDLSGSSVFVSADVSIPVVVGDFVTPKWVTPAWATNPTAVRFYMLIWVDRT